MTDVSNDTQADICIVGGAGHVGLPLALVFASKGLRVLIFDINEHTLETIKQGIVPFMVQNLCSSKPWKKNYYICLPIRRM